MKTQRDLMVRDIPSKIVKIKNVDVLFLGKGEEEENCGRWEDTKNIRLEKRTQALNFLNH